jgi:hypothetical protein
MPAVYDPRDPRIFVLTSAGDRRAQRRPGSTRVDRACLVPAAACRALPSHLVLMFGFLLACGGNVGSGPQDCNQRVCGVGSSSVAGGSFGSGGATSQGGKTATGGSPGCVERYETYPNGTRFPYNSNASISELPECIPTCGANQNSIQLLPAGACSTESTCFVMVLLLSSPDASGGVWNYYVCSCDRNQWTCDSVAG